MRWTILDRGWWRPKPGPLLTQGRIIHALIGYAVTVSGGLLGYGGLAIAGGGVVIVGWLWEAASPLFRWRHPWGDVIDFAAFEIGQIAGVLAAVATHGAGP